MPDDGHLRSEKAKPHRRAAAQKNRPRSANPAALLADCPQPRRRHPAGKKPPPFF